MKFPRSSGILLHPTSLPGPGGIGTLGPDALGFVKFLTDARCSIWQMLPLGPTGYGDSPYQCFSAFAGNPLLINLPAESEATATGIGADVDFGTVIAEKRAALRKLFQRFVPDARFERWVQQQPWLEDFALFSALKDVHSGSAWTAWAPALAAHDPAALATFAKAYARELA